MPDAPTPERLRAEQPEDAQQRMQADAAVAVDQQDGRAIRRSPFPVPGFLRLVRGQRGFDDWNQLVEAPEVAGGLPVVGLDAGYEYDEPGRDGQRDPAALVELHGDQAEQDQEGENQAGTVHEQFLDPLNFRNGRLQPVPHHAELGQGERDEDVDTVQDHEDVNRAVGEHHREQRGGADQQDAVLYHQPIAEEREPGRHPLVLGHRRQHAGPAEETRLCRDEQQGRL